MTMKQARKFRFLRQLSATSILTLALVMSGAVKSETVIDTIGQSLVLIPGGEFMMGNPYSPLETAAQFPEVNMPSSGLSDEYPLHRVVITRPFFLGKYEVTVGQFKQFVRETGYRTDAERDGLGGWGYNRETKRTEGRHPQFNWRQTGYEQTDEHPVVNVSYPDVQAYLAWLSQKEGKVYRLPTEAEWEYANRAGTLAYFGDSNRPEDVPKFARAIDLTKHAIFGHVQDLEIEPDDVTVFPTPVGRHEPNAWGLHDMHGNAWEWVQDWYGEDYYAKSPLENPQGPATGSRRVRRGGGWNSFPVWLRSSFRNISPPDTRCSNLGFRVVREL